MLLFNLVESVLGVILIVVVVGHVVVFAAG